MSVTNTTVISEQAGNGSKTAFDLSAKIFSASDLVVLKKSASGIYGAALTLGVDYLVSFDTAAETVTVTFTVAPVSGGAAVVYRVTPFVQSTSLPRASAMIEKTIENVLDRLTLELQELKEKLDRALVQPIVPTSPDPISVDPLADRRALIGQDNGDGTWTVIPSTYDPDELFNVASTFAPAYSEGLAANRPATPTVKTTYYSTDLDSLEIYIPSSGHWRLIG